METTKVEQFKINTNFKAVFNPFTRELAVKYGNEIVQYQFDELDEWYIVSYNNDENHPNFLHIHLHYDTELQLIFYPRIDNSNSLNENHVVSFVSSDMQSNEHILLAFTDDEYNRLVETLTK